jgi:hypothetical protein
MEVDEEQIFRLGLLVVLSARCGLAAWMHWSCVDLIVLGFQSVEELGVDSADTIANCLRRRI